MKHSEAGCVWTCASHQRTDALVMLTAVGVGAAVGVKTLTNEASGDVVVRSEASWPTDAVRAFGIGRAPVAAAQILNRGTTEPALPARVPQCLVTVAARAGGGPRRIDRPSGSSWVLPRPVLDRCKLDSHQERLRRKSCLRRLQGSQWAAGIHPPSLRCRSERRGFHRAPTTIHRRMKLHRWCPGRQRQHQSRSPNLLAHRNRQMMTRQRP